MIIKAKENQVNIVREITQRTICEVYPQYYPAGAVEFFREHHNDVNIMKDIKNEIVFLLLDQEQYVGTVTIKNNEICRLFVLPEFQHHGYGRKLMEYAEENISSTYSEIVLDASLPAKNIYKLRGYTETEYRKILTEFGDYLCYDVMKKKCNC